MKFRNKIGAILLSICMILPLFSMVTEAASGSVSISSKSGNVWSTVTVTCTIKCSSGAIGSANVVLKYNEEGLQFISGSNMAQGGSGSVQYAGTTQDGTSSSLSFSMTFKILKKGSHKIEVSTAEAYDIDETPFTPSFGSGTITGKEPSNNANTQNNKDKNNKLNALNVYPGTLEPAFSSDITTYTVTVPAETTEVTISATAQSSKATVNVSGGKELKLGENTAQVVVVSESGASLAYNIKIMCGEAEKIGIGGIDHTINEGFTDEQIPTGFSKTEITYKDRQYTALTDSTGKLQLINLQNGETNSFYIYYTTTQEFYPFVQVVMAEGKYIVPVPSEGVDEFAGNAMTTITVQDKVLDAWQLNDDFSVVKVLNQDGKEILYKYDGIDGTFQRYVEEQVEEVIVEKTIFPSEYYMYALAGLGALVIILSISLIYFVASRKSRHEARKRKAQKKLEKQKAKEGKI